MRMTLSCEYKHWKSTFGVCSLEKTFSFINELHLESRVKKYFISSVVLKRLLGYGLICCRNTLGFDPEK